MEILRGSSIVALVSLIAGCGTSGGPPPSTTSTTATSTASASSTPTSPRCASEPSWMLAFGGEHGGPGHLALDADCSVVVTGIVMGSLEIGGAPALTTGSTGAQFVAKVDAAGKLAWVTPIGRIGSPDALSVAATRTGDLVIAGTLVGKLDTPAGPLDGDDGTGGGQLFVARLRGDTGQIVWARLLAPYSWPIAGVAVDSQDRIVLAGTFSQGVDLGGGPLTAAGADAVVLRLGPGGEHVSTAQVGEALYERVLAFALDGSDAVHLVGSRGSVDQQCIPLGGEGGSFDCSTTWHVRPWFARVEVDGTVAWQKTGDEGPLELLAGSIAVGTDGRALSVVPREPDGRDEVGVREGATGVPLWSKTFHTGGSVVRTDASSNVYLLGMFVATDPPDYGGGYLAADVGAFPLYLAKLDASGAHVYSQGFSIGPSTYGYGLDLAVDAAGGVWMLAQYRTSFATDVGVTPAPVGGSAFAVVRFAPDSMVGEPKVKGQPGG